MSYDPGAGAPICPIHGVRTKIFGTSSAYQFVCPMGGEAYDWNGVPGGPISASPSIVNTFNPAGWSSFPGQPYPQLPGR
jgi:hypothetical protein